MCRGGAGVVLLIACLAVPAQAEEPPPRDVYTVWPWLDGTVIVAGGLASVIPLALSNQLVTARCPCNVNELPRLDQRVVGNENNTVRAISDVTLGFAVAAPLLVDYFNVGWSRALLDDAIVFAEALAVTGAITTMFKYAVQRPTPLLFDNPTPEAISNGQNYLAFYSGHVSVTFTLLSAMAMTLTLRNGFSIWPWLAVAVVGTSMGAMRIIAGQHFYTDVIVAGVMGTAVGVLVPWLHVRPEWGSPTVGANAGAVMLGWQREW